MTQAKSKPAQAHTFTVTSPERFIKREALRGLSERTLDMRSYVLTSLQHALGRPLITANRQEIEDWLASRNLGPQGRYTYLMHLKSFFRWAADEQFIEEDPTLRIPNPKIPKRLPRPIATDQLRDALAAADPMLRAWLYLGAYAGLRCHEIAGLRRNDVMDHEDPPVILINGKGGKQRIVPLHPAVAACLPLRRGFLFLHNGRPVNAGMVSREISRFFHDNGTHATAHMLRHWFGTEVYRESKDIRLVQMLLGHESLQTTQGYVAMVSTEAAQVVGRLSV